MGALAGCSHNANDQNLVAQVYGWKCPVPPGGDEIRPLHGLNVKDASGIEEAIERIELVRRRGHTDWKSAAYVFATSQFDFAAAFNYPAEYQRRALSRLQPLAGMAVEDEPGRMVADYKQQFEADCRRRNDTIKKMVAEEPELAALRQSPASWREPGNQVPCTVASVPQCLQ